jgi:xanthine/uracil permease
MSTAAVPEVREGYFPHWRLKTTGVIVPEERLPWSQTIVSGLQHGVAMAGRIWVENKVDFSNPRNLITVAAALTAGAGDLTLQFGDFTMGGIGTATFGAIILYQILAWNSAEH